MCVCMYVCTDVHVCIYRCSCMYIQMFMYVCMYVCACDTGSKLRSLRTTQIRRALLVCMYVRMYVRMYVCMYVRMYVCTYLWSFDDSEYFLFALLCMSVRHTSVCVCVCVCVCV